MTKRMVCTCKYQDEPIKHSKECALQRSKQFRSGKLVWNMYQERLTTKEVAIDDEVANDKVAAEALQDLAEDERHDYPACPTCDTDVNVACVDCGIDWLDCRCGEREVDEWYCRICGTGFTCSLHYDIDDDEIIDLTKDIKVEAAEPEPCTCKPQKTYCWVCGVQQNFTTKEWKFIVKSGYSSTTYTPKCRHYNAPVTLPDGVIIHVSSLCNERKDTDIIPDWGLYLDYSWRPTWRSEHINWPDFGLPKNFEAAAEAIVHAYDIATKKGIVEIGCIGGHGRTGTALACMAILSGVPADEVVKWVHKNHCTHAIESKKQEWFPLWFDAYIRGTEAPPMPVETYSNSVSGSFCSKKEHETMWNAGHRTCVKDGDKCSWWHTDTKDLEDVLGAKLYTCSEEDHREQRRLGVLECPQKCQWWAGDVQGVYADTESKPTMNITVTLKDEAPKGEQKCLPVQQKPLVSRFPCARCKAPLVSGTLECPDCNTKYAEVYWAHQETQASRLQIGQAASQLQVGDVHGNYVYTNEGWVHKGVLKQELTDKGLRWI